MKKFVVERNSTEGGIFVKEELQVISTARPDKAYYTIITEIDEILDERARSKDFPINLIPELKVITAPQPIFL